MRDKDFRRACIAKCDGDKQLKRPKSVRINSISTSDEPWYSATITVIITQVSKENTTLSQLYAGQTEAVMSTVSV